MRTGPKQKRYMLSVGRMTVAAILAGFAQGCATSHVEEVTGNTFSMSTYASPICNATGQKKAQLKGAAVKTLESGFDRFRVFAEDDSGVITSEIDFSGVVSLAGREPSGITPIAVDIPHLKMRVKMYRAGEPGAAGAIPAREVLGPDWKKELHTEKSWTCTD